MKSVLISFLGLFLIIWTTSMNAQTTKPSWMTNAVQKMSDELVVKFGESKRTVILKGLSQVAEFWFEEDGNENQFEEFVLQNFAGDKNSHDELLHRFEYLLEQTDGHFNKLTLDYKRQTDLEIGPVLPVDELFAGYDPSAHLNDDLFQNKIAFVVLLNFPLTTLDERINQGKDWTREQWAETRLAQRFSKRIPANVNLAYSEASAKSGNYIAGYNIWMHHIINGNGERLFPPEMRLLSHWNLRDELKSNYEAGEVGFQKQKTIQKIMERIVDQTIPEAVIDNPTIDWNPFTNEVKKSGVDDYSTADISFKPISKEREDDVRYQMLLDDFKAAKLADPFSPTAPTLIDRKFNEGREMSEQRVKEIFISVLASPFVQKTAQLIETRLGRKLEPFDIWYNGFKPKITYDERTLDSIVAKKYPTTEAFKKDIPSVLMNLGFSETKANLLAANIEVDAARGSGHAWGANMRSEKAHLRTRVGKNGMNYKAYNIAIHELGHNIEQTFSLNFIDHYMLQGVPNTAFTEACAFLFQHQDLYLLELQGEDKNSEALAALQDFWSTYEIAGVALVDMEVWHWMYQHPNATKAELKKAVLNIAKSIWNEYYAPVFNVQDVTLLAIYSHMIDSFLYLPDYPLGHIISFQITQQIRNHGNLGKEFERMATFGAVAPDIWMMHATGAPVSARFMLDAVKEALGVIKN